MAFYNSVPITLLAIQVSYQHGLLYLHMEKLSLSSFYIIPHEVSVLAVTAYYKVNVLSMNAGHSEAGSNNVRHHLWG